MKRSEINSAISRAKARLEEYQITLPMFAYWSIVDWKANADKTDRICEVIEDEPILHPLVNEYKEI